jgi:hypothetical protein
MAAAPAAPNRMADVWYWSPGLCKSMLKNWGIRIDDGRTFSVSNVFCIGKGGPATCEWNKSYTKRLYTRFIVFARSPDSTVRGFTLRPAAEKNFRVADIEAFGPEPSAAAFESEIGPLAARYARQELERGCARYSP